MSLNNKLFLETTIQIERFSADKEKKAKIDEIVSQFDEILSSTYVKMEFRRRFIQDLVYLYNEALIDAENFADVFLRINKLHADYHKRKIKGIIAGFCRFFSDKKEEEINGPIGKELLEMAIPYFRQAIEIAWESFDNGIHMLLNETDCFHAKNKPILKGEKFDNKLSHCKKSDIKCKIVDFFNQHKELFKAIHLALSQIKNLDDEQEKIQKALESAFKFPQNMADRETCWKCGDAIIAVESPKEAILLTTNIKHFEPICSTLNKKCTTPFGKQL